MLDVHALTFALLAAPAAPEATPDDSLDPATVADGSGGTIWRGTSTFRFSTPALRAPELTLVPRSGGWQPFRILGRGRLGTWSLMGMVAGARGECRAGVAAGCSLPADAGIALGWRPRRSAVTFFGGVTMTRVVRRSGSAQPGVAAMGGVSVALPNMVDVVNLMRGLSPSSAWLMAIGSTLQR